MLPKRLLALTLFAALAVMPVGMLRAQWQSTQSPSGGSVNSFAVLGDKIFAGTQEIGVLVSTDGGATWSSASPDLSQSHITALAVSGTSLFAGTFYAQIYRSTDSGSSWTLLNTGTYDEIRAFEVTGNSIFAAAGISGVWRSTDGGTKWTQVTAGLSTKYVNAFETVGSYLYAAGSSGVFRSNNNGNSWSRFSVGLTDTDCFNLAAVGSNLFVGTTSGIFLSSEGYPWAPLNSILPPYTISTISLLAFQNGSLFAGTFDGIFQTTDAGSTWSAVNTSLTDSISICDLATDGKYLFSGMFYGSNNGIWRRLLSDFGLSVVTGKEMASTNIHTYPNPFSQSTEITFTSQGAGYANVSIVNLLGVEVARLFSGELQAGEHSFSWGNPTGLPDGVYECLIRKNGRVEKLPMMLLR